MCNLQVKAFLILLISLHQEAWGQQKVTKLTHYPVNKDYITLSGFSSGGTFAQTMFFSYSSLFSGIAVFSHTHYRCGPVTTNVDEYDLACTTLFNNTQLYDLSNVFRDIMDYISRGVIESPIDMKNKPLYIYIGKANYLFTPEMQRRIRDIFHPFIGSDKSIRVVYQNANVTLPTNRPDYPSCSAPPNDLALSNCGYSGAFEALQFLLGYGTVRHAAPVIKLEPLQTFDQTEFFYGLAKEVRQHGMDTQGYFYIPKMCRNGRVQCLLHFYFHGCTVGREYVGAEHIRNSGYLEVAETNGIIMIFPQVVSSTLNPIGCWDTYGFTGELYATQKGAQVTIVRNMISRILGDDINKKTTNSFSSYFSASPASQFEKENRNYFSNFMSSFPRPPFNIF